MELIDELYLRYGRLIRHLKEVNMEISQLEQAIWEEENRIKQSKQQEENCNQGNKR